MRAGSPTRAIFAWWGGTAQSKLSRTAGVGVRRRNPERSRGNSNPDAAYRDHPATGSSTETPVLTFSAVRDSFYYKFWV
jgi:hypothetical protein